MDRLETNRASLSESCKPVSRQAGVILRPFLYRACPIGSSSAEVGLATLSMSRPCTLRVGALLSNAVSGCTAGPELLHARPVFLKRFELSAYDVDLLVKASFL